MNKSRIRLYSIIIGQLIFFSGLLAGDVALLAQEKNFLWKIDTGKNNVYLLGSVHLLKKGDAPFTPIIDETFSRAKRLVFEIDILGESPEKTQQLILQKGINLDGKTLRQTVSEETFQMASAWAKDLGLDVKVLSPFKPWLAALTLMVMQLQKLGYDPTLGVDRQLAQRAKETSKPVSGLETSERQFDLLDGLPPGLQEMMLRQSLAEVAQIGKVVGAMVRAWRNGDVAAAETFFLASMKEYPELQEKIIDQRNRAWLPQIERLLKSQEDVLVVVGAAHLIGKNGVIELLKGRGYKVEQM